MKRFRLVIRKAGIVGYLLLTQKLSSLSREAKLWRFIRNTDSLTQNFFLSSHSGLLPMPYALSYRMRRRQHTNIYQYQDRNIHGVIVVRRRRRPCLEIQLLMTKQRAHGVGQPLTFSDLGELHYQAQEQSVT
jgi:hypothetical protein